MPCLSVGKGLKWTFISLKKKQTHGQFEAAPNESDSLEYYKLKLNELNAKCYSLEKERNSLLEKAKQLDEENLNLKSQLTNTRANTSNADGAIDSSSMQIIEHTNLKINSLKEIDK